MTAVRMFSPSCRGTDAASHATAWCLTSFACMLPRGTAQVNLCMQVSGCSCLQGPSISLEPKLDQARWSASLTTL